MDLSQRSLYRCFIRGSSDIIVHRVSQFIGISGICIIYVIVYRDNRRGGVSHDTAAGRRKWFN